MDFVLPHVTKDAHSHIQLYCQKIHYNLSCTKLRSTDVFASFSFILFVLVCGVTVCEFSIVVLDKEVKQCVSRILSRRTASYLPLAYSCKKTV